MATKRGAIAAGVRPLSKERRSAQGRSGRSPDGR